MTLVRPWFLSNKETVIGPPPGHGGDIPGKGRGGGGKGGNGGGWTGRGGGGGWGKGGKNGGGGGGGGGDPILAFDFTSNRKTLYPFSNGQVAGSVTDGWAFYADFEYIGGDQRHLFIITPSQGLNIRMHSGKIEVSNGDTWVSGSSTFTAGRYRVVCWYNGTTLKAWVKPGGGSRTEEINQAYSFSSSVGTGDIQMGGAYADLTTSGLSRFPLGGKMYAGAYWRTHMTEADALDLVDGNIEIGGVTQAPTWWPDPNDTARDQTSAVTTMKTFGDPRQLTTQASAYEIRVLRDPETSFPVTYDEGSGAVYWAALTIGGNSIYLATSTDLETWTQHSQLFSGEGGTLRTSDFLYLGNIAGAHDPFLLLTTTEVGVESMIHARTSSDMSTWTYPTIDAANAMFRDFSVTGAGVEGFGVVRYGGEWIAAYEHEIENGTIAIGIAVSTATLPSSGWSIANSQAFTTTDPGYGNAERFLTNPVAVVKDGDFWLFYEGVDWDDATRAFPSTFLRKTTTPKTQSGWEAYGMVFNSLGRKAFPHSVTIESGQIALYLQNGLGKFLGQGQEIGKVEYDISYLLVE